METRIFSVKEITEYIKKLISADEILADLWITGEISNYHHHSSGHMYFSLKDSGVKLDAVMFKYNNKKIKFTPEEGLQINAHGYIDIYAPRGSYQFYIDKMEPVGKGSLYLAFEQLKKKLAEEGLFADENKRDIPLIPTKIGVVTSPSGAAIRDILSVAERRFDGVSLLVVPSLVQGEKAAAQIVRGIKYLNKLDDVDLIIISRGGGSIEDLWPFNEEIVARAVYESRIPVISGVGHETDFTIADFVADLRAPTPSAAAELAVANRLELEKNIRNLRLRLRDLMNNRIGNYREKLRSLAGKRIFTGPLELYSDQIQKLDDLKHRLYMSKDKVINDCQKELQVLAGKLETLSPLKTLKRGYTITGLQDGKIVTKVDDVEVDDDLLTRVTDGIINSQVQEIRDKGEDNGRK